MNYDINGFTIFFNRKINLHKVIDDENIRLVNGNYNCVYILDINDLSEQQKNNLYISNIRTTPNTFWFCEYLNLYFRDNSCLLYPYLNQKDNIELIEENIPLINNNSRRYANDIIVNNSSFIVKLNKRDNNYYISYYINNNIIDSIRNNKRRHTLTALKNLLIEQKRIELLDYFHKESIQFKNQICEDFTNNTNKNIDLLKDNLLKDKVKLYNYQEKDIIWMQNIEDNVDNNMNIISYDTSSMFFVLNNEFVICDSNLIQYKNNIDKKNVSFKYYGGNLISDVGLGKTITTLYHIFSSDIKNKSKYDYFVDFSDSCNYFYKRGKNKGKNCSNKILINKFYCREHEKSIFIDKKSIILKNLEKFSPEDFIININNSKFIKTNSNLVLCPSHLCNQWLTEYYNNFIDTKRVILIVTYDQFTNLTLADILFSDLIIISYNFLINKNYNKKIPNNFILENFNLNKFNNKYDLLNSNIFNCLSLFYWNRIICDEAHEITDHNFKNNLLKNSILSFCSKYKWNITATPFANNIGGFLNLMYYNSDYIKNNMCFSVSNLLRLGFDSNIIEKCKIMFRRNTKSSIKDEYAGNIIINNIKSLEFTTQERCLYDSYIVGMQTKYSEFLIKLCCHSELNNHTKQLIKNCKTFTEIQNVILNWNKKQLDIEKNKVKLLELDIEHYELLLQTTTEIEAIENLKIKISTCKRNLTNTKKKYNEFFRTWNYLKKTLEELQENNSSLNCPICLDDIEEDNIAITKCGHKFCWNCIYQTYTVSSKNENIIKCPTCNNLMKNTDIYLLNNIQQENIIYSELNDIINNVKSTKIGNIIYFLKTTIEKSDKVILFSQWDELLHKVGNIIEKYNIKPLYCTGTVYQKKRVIDKFSNDNEYNLIMLSSNNCASGLNLTIANKIIFLEPIYGSKEYRSDIQSQAIGRCDRISQKRPIEIYNFIIKNTIEEDIINNSIDDVNIENMNLI